MYWDVAMSLDRVGGDIVKGRNTDSAQKLVELYIGVGPDAFVYDKSAKDGLIAELREAVYLFPSDVFRRTSLRNKEETSDERSKYSTTIVCSDVHLGTTQARREAFFQWLSTYSDTTIVLLGDILDLWVYSKKLDDNALIELVTAEWKDLWGHLSEAKNRGCHIHFVPGNHDAFVYFIETADHDNWSHAILEKTPLLRAIRDRTRDQSLLAIAELHYPYLRLQIRYSTILLTHGHYATWGWRLLMGLEEACPKLHPAVASASVVLAHKNARLLRRINNERDWLRRTHQIEDAAISITNAMLSAYEGSLLLLNNNEQDFVTLIDRATAIYFGAKTDASAVEKLKIREALLHMTLNHSRNRMELLSVRDQHLSFLEKSKGGSNVDLVFQDGSALITHTPFQEFIKFDSFIFGHYHSPRDEEEIHDTGGFVDSIETFLSIDANGRISR
jgi:UDP-2,3-diacylglucosamine pyrophosphatase LpxH